MRLALLYLAIVIMAPASSPALSLKSQLNRDGPELILIVTPEESARDNFLYDVHITVGEDTDQHFKVRNGQVIGQDELKLMDINADGCLDIMIAGGKDHRGENWYKTWIYDTKQEKYRWIND